MKFCIGNVHNLGRRPAFGLKDPSLLWLCHDDATLLGVLFWLSFYVTCILMCKLETN